MCQESLRDRQEKDPNAGLARQTSTPGGFIAKIKKTKYKIILRRKKPGFMN